MCDNPRVMAQPVCCGVTRALSKESDDIVEAQEVQTKRLVESRTLSDPNKTQSPGNG